MHTTHEKNYKELKKHNGNSKANKN